MNAIVKKFGLILVAGFGLVAAGSAQTNQPLYENNFEKAAVGSLPEEFLVLDGGFVVQEEAGNKFLELPGAPLETFGVLFGPTENENTVVSARVFGTGKGRRFPTFALGLGGQGGYRVQVAPAKKSIELYKGDTVKTSIPYEWEASQWTQLKIQIRKAAPAEWKIEAKVWPHGTKEPESWTLIAEEKQKPSNGRASIWGSPYAGTPIRFDDLLVARTRE
jgi:hypothetical protein